MGGGEGRSREAKGAVDRRDRSPISGDPRARGDAERGYWESI